jgi:O-palmitoleoyl-L-serine hydrolase
MMILLLLLYLCNSETIAELHILNDVSNGARCLDGSHPGYYLSKGSDDGINKWFIYHMGGAWCINIEDCYYRSKTSLGSINIWWPKVHDLSGWGDSPGVKGGYFSDNPIINPLMYNWNKVILIYCDGGSFSGHNFTKTIYNNTEIFFRGFLNLVGYRRDLVENHNFINATDIVISGASAGGLSTFLHLDWWKSQINKNTKIIGFPENGFFPDYDKIGFSKTMRNIFNLMNCTLGVNQKCIESNTIESNCFFAEYNVPFITTPIFAVQSRFDSWQIGAQLGANPTYINEINEYGDWFTNLFTSTILKNEKNGIFLDSCYHHSITWNIKINNTNVGYALKDFYENGYPRIYIQNNSYICNECCYI